MGCSARTRLGNREKALAPRRRRGGGGWKTVQTLEQSYARADSETLLAVVTEPRKLQEAK